MFVDRAFDKLYFFMKGWRVYLKIPYSHSQFVLFSKIFEKSYISIIIIKSNNNNNNNYNNNNYSTLIGEFFLL